jgi:ribose/xylose/arabinose/galactoside ABC-type transport system permease subunit
MGQSPTGNTTASCVQLQNSAVLGFELMAISAVVIGGTPLTGGMGSIVGTVVGSLVITILANGLIILGISTNVQTVLTGAVLIVAVLISIRRDKIRVIK